MATGHDGEADDHAGHAHGGHGHSHAPASFGRAFLIGTILNVGFVAVEAGYGFAANSVALLADAATATGGRIGPGPLLTWPKA